MRVTRRERNLLFLLLTVVILGGYLYYFEDYFDDDVAMLEIEIAAKEEMIRKALTIDDEKKNFQNQYMLLKDEIDTKINKMFVNVNQEDIIMFLNELLTDSRVKVSQETYTIDESIPAGDLVNNIFNIELEYQGDYEGFTVILGKIWDYSKVITLNNLVFNKDLSGAEELSASILISMYNLTLESDETDRLILWTLKDIEGLRNPFEEIRYPDVTSDYLYNGDPFTEDAALVFGSFEDISGHWAEHEITIFNQLNYVYGIEDNLFEPDAPVTKSQLIVMLDRILQWPLSANTLDLTGLEGFEDLDGFEYEYKKALYKGYATGVLESLGPDELMTRGQVEMLIQSTMNPEFTWEELIEIMKLNQVDLTEYPEGDNQVVTRAEAVYLLHYFK